MCGEAVAASRLLAAGRGGSAPPRSRRAEAAAVRFPRCRVPGAAVPPFGS